MHHDDAHGTLLDRDTEHLATVHACRCERAARYFRVGNNAVSSVQQKREHHFLRRIGNQLARDCSDVYRRGDNPRE